MDEKYINHVHGRVEEGARGGARSFAVNIGGRGRIVNRGGAAS